MFRDWGSTPEECVPLHSRILLFQKSGVLLVVFMASRNLSSSKVFILTSYSTGPADFSQATVYDARLDL